VLTICKTSSGQCLFVDELSGDFRANLNPIQVAPCDGSTGQLWDVITAGKHNDQAGTMLVVNTLVFTPLTVHIPLLMILSTDPGMYEFRSATCSWKYSDYVLLWWKSRWKFVTHISPSITQTNIIRWRCNQFPTLPLGKCHFILIHSFERCRHLFCCHISECA
jgi:hypothetical protein